MVAIKDMEMPTCCECCFAFEESDYGDYCKLLAKDVGNKTKKLDNCPLVELVDVEEVISHNTVKIFDVEKLNGLFPRNKQEQNTEWTSKIY